MTKTILKGIAQLVASFAVLGWFTAFSYADWLCSVDPRHPDPSSGHVIFLKAVKGVCYATASQAFWADTILPFIWLAGAAGIGASVLLQRTEPQSHAAGAEPVPQPIALWRRLVGLLCFGTMAALFFFGDNLISWIFTGSLTLPRPPQ